MGSLCSSEAGKSDQSVDVETKRSNKNKKSKMAKEEAKVDPNVDYATDVGLHMNPQNELQGLTYDIKKDLAKLKQFYPKLYQDLVKRDISKTVFYSDFDEKYIESNGFSVMQFNMLADSLSHAYLPGGMDNEKSFVGVDKRCLEWRYRGLRIVEEITRLSPDLICLQECDRVEFLDKYLSKLGYKYIFQEKGESAAWNEVMPEINKARKKARESIVQSDLKEDSKEKDESETKDVIFQSDGVAIFYNTKKFSIIEREKTKLHKIEKQGNKFGVVALAVPFTFLDSNKKATKHEFFAVTSHLKSTKTAEGEKKRESQINALCNELIENNEKLPVLLCLDMNATHKNNKYEALCYNKITKEFGYVSLHKEALTTKDEINKKMKCGERGTEPEFTTYKTRSTGTVKHTIDYIFESGENVWSVTKYSPIPESAKMIPDWNYPSDHFSLYLHLTWKQ